MHFSRHLFLPAMAVFLMSIYGCGRASIPAGAQEVRSGSGDLSYTATQSGNVYVLDRDANAKVFEGQMKNGDQLVLQPGQDRIVLGGNNADHTPALNPNHRYAIYFIPG